ncbi:Peptide transporter family 1 [Frankliniella fusca]|uniref:Oligopeptide transporter 1 n=1 Tax=Frankliniella fusca TaxID=407009 RepID=A0AAE1LRN5_9NEOP|nr:Peptide transporter family 1 [Frankliniella fusca]
MADNHGYEQDDAKAVVLKPPASHENGGDRKVSNFDIQDAEVPEKKLKYPKVVFFIISNEFCERFTFYGMRTVLSLFLKNALMMEESDATITYHVWTLLCYFFPVVGAIIADSWLGKFKTIAILSIVYAIGNIVVSLSAVTTWGLPSLELTYLGLMLIAIGTGGIKPCVASFGGEQFTVPQQAKQLAGFFSVFYFSINAGSLISTFLTPELRGVSCLGMDTCYPLAFGVPAILMIVAIVIFIAGSGGYKITKPKGNIMVDVTKCMGSAVVNKIKSKEKKDHWLDYAGPAYSQTLRDDIRAVLRVLILFVPMPIFWALYDQQGSKWTFQANNMNGRIGSWVFKPDQMQVVNPILIMILLPLFEYIVYPLLSKMRLMRKPLQRIATGGMLAAVAFIVSALIQIQLDPNLPRDTERGFAQVRVFSSLPCNVTLSGSGGSDAASIEPFNLPSMGYWERLDFAAEGSADLSLSVKGSCVDDYSAKLTIEEKNAVSFHLYLKDPSAKQVTTGGPYVDEFFKDAVAKVRIMYRFDSGSSHSVNFKADGRDKTFDLDASAGVYEMKDLEPAQYTITVDGKPVADVPYLDVGGFYYLLVDSTASPMATLLTVIPANELSLFWQMPQYIIISVAEIMVSVTGNEFSFTQAPNSMKAVVFSAWLITDAFGNAIIIIIESVKIFPRQSDEIFLFAGLMVFIMLVFIWLAVQYKPVEPPASEEEEEDTAPAKDKKRNSMLDPAMAQDKD